MSLWAALDSISRDRMNTKTNYIGASEPATMFAGMIWYDTSTNTFKQRNAANEAWDIQINQSLLTISSPTFAGLTINAVDDSVGSALSIRQGNAPIYGFDFKLDSVINGDLYLYRIVNSIPSLVYTIARGSGNITFENNILVPYISVGSSGILITNTASNTASTLFLQSDVKLWQLGVLGSAVGSPRANSFEIYNLTDSISALVVTSAGQLQLPVSGLSGGLVIGGDVNLYRSAANVLKTDDDVECASGKGLILIDTILATRYRVNVTNGVVVAVAL